MEMELGMIPVKVLFLDIGGVLLTNGFDEKVRRRAAEKFGLNFQDFNDRHHLTFNSFEEGKISFDTFLKRVIFYKKRNFSIAGFKRFIFSQMKSFPATMGFIKEIARHNKIRICAISNEGRELMTYRIKKFGLDQFIDFFIVSSYVHIRKPDEGIYRLALDLANVTPENAVYIDDRILLVEVAKRLGIPSIHHKNLENTKKELARFGLSIR